MGIYEKIRRETEQSLVKDAQGMSFSTLKTLSVRLIPEYVTLIDKLSENLDQTRQVFLAGLVYEAVDEAVNAYASVFENPSEVSAELLKSCGFIYGNYSQTQFLDYCKLNGYDPHDQQSLSDFQMVVDHIEDQREQAWGLPPSVGVL
jgi:hypothetical protein